MVEEMKPEEFKNALMNLGISQKQFSRYVGVSEGWVSGWVNGRSQVPTYVHTIIILLTQMNGFQQSEFHRNFKLVKHL
jgi:DNA-binding transcriptional regulator YiaG